MLSGKDNDVTVSTSAIPYFEEAVSDSEITDSINSGAVSRSIPPTGYPKNNPISAEIVTDAMRACWYELKQSNLPDNLFTELMNCAVYSQKNRGLEEVSEAAISDFLEFWKEVPNMVEPLLTTTPNGGVGLEWFKDPDHVLAMMFPGNSYAIFNLFDGDAEVDGREPRAAFREIVAMLEVRNASPFLWTETDA